MADASDRVVTVFGGTGFLGRRIVRHLRLHGFCVRAASRHPDRGDVLCGPDDPQLRSIKANVHDERSVAEALADAYGAVNAVSLYVEHRSETFHSVHVESAQRIAAQAQRAGVKRLVHVSGIGADFRSQSLYIRKRGEGELAVREAFADAIIIRPAVMFGLDDAFLTIILKLIDRLPIYPMFSTGQMRLQPVYVEDVGHAIAKMLQRAQTHPTTFECGGPRVYSYEEFLRTVASAAGIQPILFPVPFAAWHALARIAEMFPSPPITRNQVELMQIDSASSPDMPGMGELGISPHSIEEILQDILKKPLIEKKPKQDLDCGKADYAIPPRLTGMSAKLDRAITQGGRASVVVEQRPLQPRASPVGIASAVVVAIRRSAVTTRSRAPSWSATVHCRGSGRVRFLRARFAALLTRMAALSCLPIAIVATPIIPGTPTSHGLCP